MKLSSMRVATAAALFVIAMPATAPAQVATATVTGHVRRADGSPLEGIDVSLQEGSYTFAATTGSDGSYSAEVPPNSYYICTGDAEHGVVRQCYDHIDQTPFLGPQFTWVTVGDGETVAGIDFDLSAGGSIEGRVTDGLAGTPLANQVVSVSLFDANLEGWRDVPLQTDPDGNYRLGGIPPGAWYVIMHTQQPLIAQVWPDVPCYDTNCDIASGELLQFANGDAMSDLDFALQPDVVIRGRVSDATTGLGLANMTVNSYWAWALPFGWDVFTVTTTQSDAAGNYVLYGFGTSESDDTVYYVGTFGSAPYVDVAYPDAPFADVLDVVYGTPLTFRYGSELDGIDLALPQGGAIAGTVYNVHTGSPLRQVPVTIFKADASVLTNVFTDDNGRYTTPGWFPGTYYLQATALDGPQSCSVYLERPCPDTGSILSVDPTPLVLSANQLRTGIDFQLDVDHVFVSSFELQ